MAQKLDRRQPRLEVKTLVPRGVDGRPPPHDLDAEAAVLSAVLLAPIGLDEIEWLLPEHFYSEKHRRIFEAIAYLRAQATRIDVVTVGTRLKDTDQIAAVGGMAGLTEIIDAAPAVRNVATYARTVLDKARVRKLIAACQYAEAEGYLDSVDASEYLARASQEIAHVAESGSGGRLVRIGAAAIFAPLPPEPPWLCKGLRIGPGRVVLVAGSPDSGKTLGVQALAAAVALGRDVWDSFPVTRRALAVHMNWDQPDIDTRRRYQKIARGWGASFDDFNGFLEIVNKPPISLDDDGAFAEIRAIAREAGLIVIDALTGALGDVDENSPAVGRVLYRLGAISEETGCVILVIHHATKPPPQMKGRPFTRDPLFDLRGSGSIAGAAGAVFVQRAIRKGDLYGMTMARAPTSAKSALEPFALRFTDTVDDQTGQPIDGVRVTYIDPDELAAMKKASEKTEGHVDRAAYIGQVQARIVEIVKSKPGLDTSDLYELVPKMRKSTFNTALKLLASPDGGAPARLRDGKGGKIGDRKPKEWHAT